MIDTFFSFIKALATTTYAHVGYVVGENEFAQNLGHDTNYFLSPLTESRNLLLIFSTLAVVFVLYFLAWKIPAIKNRIIALRLRLDTYREYVPWILRLSLGIAFIGASVAQVLISPTLPHPGFVGMQLVIGFALLGGVAVVPAVILASILFIVAIAEKAYIIGNAELFAALLSLLILGGGRPGMDDLFGIPEWKVPHLKKYVPVLLRIGIGGALVFLSLYEKVLNPHVSDLVVAKYHLTTIIPVGAAMWVFAVGMIELAVGVLLFIGFQTRLVSAIAFLVLIVTFFFFKEEVYSHVTLFGVLSVLFITGAGPLSIDAVLRKR